MYDVGKLQAWALLKGEPMMLFPNHFWECGSITKTNDMIRMRKFLMLVVVLHLLHLKVKYLTLFDDKYLLRDVYDLMRVKQVENHKYSQ